MTENQLMMKCIALAKSRGLHVIHIPNERGTAKHRAIGMRRGAPDLLLIGQQVAFVELKRNDNIKASADQLSMLESLKGAGIRGSVIGTESRFLQFIKALDKPTGKKVGTTLPLRSSVNQMRSSMQLPMHRVSEYFMSRQGDYEPHELFAIRLDNSEHKTFPWLIDIKNHNFVATSPSKITAHLLSIGWDIVML